MKRKLILVTIFLLLLSVVLVAQETSKGIKFGLKTGAILPISDELSETVTRAWLVGADLKYFFTKTLAIGVDVRYGSQGWKGDYMHHSLEGIAEMSGTQIDWVTMPISFNVYYRSDLGEGSNLYFGFGPTLMRTKINMDFGIVNTGTPGSWSNVNGTNTSWWSQTNWVNYRPIDVAIDENEWGYGYNGIVGFEFGSFFVEGQIIMSETSYRDASFFFGGGDGKVDTGNYSVVFGYRF